jgi:crotonobetainyl-CoA:carnitine CoA-transferase CaiB-like acyl-CoA transferase
LPDALTGIRVLDCGEFVAASYAAKQLADLGAEVIKVEPIGGDRARARGPYPGGAPDPNRSGLFLYLNTNKRGVAIDLDTSAGRDLLDRLVDSADLVLHDLPADLARVRGLDAAHLRKDRPRLVATSISPFGLTGPRAGLRAHDLNLWCASGLAVLNGAGPGRDDLPPLKPFGAQASFQAGLNAAVASLAALYERETSGLGQTVEISTHECLASIAEMTFAFYPYMGLVPSRLGQKPIQPLDFLECSDGWIFICCVEEHQWQRFVELAGSPEWGSLEIFENRLARGVNWDALKIFLNEYTATRTVQDLYREAQERRIPFAPVSTMGDLLASEHLRERGFFATLDDGAGGRTTMPGAPYRHARTPWRIRRRAPRLGEHTDEVLAELGLSARSAELRASGVVR